MTTITPDEMKSLETLFMSETGTPSILLMEHAAQGVAAAISRHAPKSARVLFLCGPGSNGGDGYAAARLWCLGGGQADVWEVTSAVRGDALTNRTLALLHGVRILPSADAVDVAEYAAVVDALYGTGLNHAIEGDAAILIHRLNDHPQIPVIAVDIPSGLDGTTGRRRRSRSTASSRACFCGRASNTRAKSPCSRFSSAPATTSTSASTVWRRSPLPRSRRFSPAHPRFTRAIAAAR